MILIQIFSIGLNMVGNYKANEYIGA